MMWDVIAAAYMGAYQDAQRRADDAQRRADDAQRRADEESCIPTIERGSHGADCGWKCTSCKATNAGDVHRCIWCRTYRVAEIPRNYNDEESHK